MTLTPWNSLVELLPRAKEMRHELVEVVAEDSLAEAGPLREVLGCELAWERPCDCDDAFLEDLAGHHECLGQKRPLLPGFPVMREIFLFCCG
jgi:hypothetical protein